MKKLIKNEFYKYFVTKKNIYLLIFIIIYSLLVTSVYVVKNELISISLYYFFSDFSVIILIYAVYISSKIYYKEYLSETINILYLLPYSKKQILFSKYITLLIVIAIFIFFIYLVHLLINLIILSPNGLNNPIYIESIQETVLVINYNNIMFFYFYLSIIIISTFTYLLSVILNKSIMIIVFILYFIGEVIIINNLSISKYLIFTNWDYLPYAFNPINTVINLDFYKSLFICIIYLSFMCFLLFKRFKDK